MLKARDTLSFKPVPFYCEENVWMFFNERSPYAPGDAFAVFISNAERKVSFYHQINRDGKKTMVWDYHVVALVRENSEWFVCDFNCDLGNSPGCNRGDIPGPGNSLPASTWISASFGSGGFPPLFKLVPATEYVRTFVSDRAHMMDDAGSFCEPPPSWPCIGHGRSNLARFIDMSDGLALSAFTDRFAQ